MATPEKKTKTRMWTDTVPYIRSSNRFANLLNGSGQAYMTINGTRISDFTAIPGREFFRIGQGWRVEVAIEAYGEKGVIEVAPSALEGINGDFSALCAAIGDGVRVLQPKFMAEALRFNAATAGTPEGGLVAQNDTAWRNGKTYHRGNEVLSTGELKVIEFDSDSKLVTVEITNAEGTRTIAAKYGDFARDSSLTKAGINLLNGQTAINIVSCIADQIKALGGTI